MAYNSRNLLLKIIEIQDIVLAAKRRGVSQVYVYENEIRDKYFISLPTFNNYLARNARRELSLLQQRENAKKQQLNLFGE